MIVLITYVHIIYKVSKTIVGKIWLPYFSDLSNLISLLACEEIENLIDDPAMFIDSCWLGIEIVSIGATVAKHYFLSWPLSTFQSVSTRSGKTILLPTICLLTNSINFMKAILYHGYFLSESIHFYHFFQILSEDIIVILGVFCIFCHWVEIELALMVLPEELLLYLLLMRSLFRLFLKDSLNFTLIWVVFMDVPFIVCAKFIHASMKVTSWDYISFIVLTHSHFINCYFLAIFISNKNSQFYSFTKLHLSILEIQELRAYFTCIHTAEYGKIEHLQSSWIVLNILMNGKENG